MTPSALEGLNIVQPEEPSSSSYLNDQQDLLAAPQFPDLAAQLDLWTNLTFESDEPLVKRSACEPSSPTLSDEDKDDELEREGTAALDGHTNIINPTERAQHPQHASFDVNSILAGFGIDPFLVPPVNEPQPSQAASLAQLLAAYPFAPPPFFGQLSNQILTPPQPESASSSAAKSSSTAPPPAKRSRTRKSSAAASAATSSISISTPARDESPQVASPEESTSNGTSLNGHEDKRRRNTAASARFRAKKKEREAALEKRSKELESRVGELERECEALRRENGWLKGLVVGVTGAQVSAPSEKKRKRDEKEVQPVGPDAVVV